MKGGSKEYRDSKLTNKWICWGYLGSFCRITFVLKSFEFPFCFFFFIVFLMFIWTAVNRNKLRYVQLSQERHMIQGANVPGTAVQLQWSNARVLCTALESISEKWGKKDLAKTTPKRKKTRKREANKQRAASHLELRWKGAAKKIAKVANEYAEDVGVSFLCFRFHGVLNVHLNCGESE